MRSSPSIIQVIKPKRDELGRVCGMHGRDKSAYRVLVRKAEGRRLQGRLMRRWAVAPLLYDFMAL